MTQTEDYKTLVEKTMGMMDKARSKGYDPPLEDFLEKAFLTVDENSGSLFGVELMRHFGLWLIQNEIDRLSKELDK